MQNIENSILKISGSDAASFLQGLITQDVVLQENYTSRYGALLTPQGKVVADFIIYKQDDVLYLTTWQGFATELLKRFNFYKLRANVMVEDVTSNDFFSLSLRERVHDRAGEGIIHEHFSSVASRHLLSSGEGRNLEYSITHCLPQAGVDFHTNEVFPFEINMDKLNGISFTKGCYIGQEVVSRMHHKSTIRTRTLKVNANTKFLENEKEIYAGPIQIGTLGARLGTQGLARLRLDRVQEAIANGLPITCGGVEIQVEMPEY